MFNKEFRLLLKRNTLLIVFVASTVASVLLWIIPFTREFGVNFISEMAGVWITVFLVNRILEKRERQKRVAIDLRILRETQSIIATYFSIWKHLVWKYRPEVRIQNEDDLKKIYADLLRVTRLDDHFEVVAIHDPESWKLFFHHRTIKECFENYYTSLFEDIKSTMDNFKVHIEPELLGALLEITESRYFQELNSLMRKEETDAILNEFRQDTDRLISYLVGNPDHFDQISQLKEYCHKLGVRIAEFTEVPQNQYDLKRYFVMPVFNLPKQTAAS